MKTLLTLIKTNLNVNFGISALKYRFTKEKKRLWEPIAVLAAAVFGIGSLIVLWSTLLTGIFLGGLSINHPEMILTIAFMAGQFMVLIFGMFYIVSSFYFSKDMNLLLPMPLRPSHVIGSKIVVIMINEYLILLPLILPALIIYGTGTHQGILYWVKGLVLLLSTPIIPLMIDSLFIMVLMRFVNLRKSKDLLVIIGSFIGVLFGLSINFFAQKMPEGNEQEFINELIQSQSGLINAIGQKFPPSIWATYGLSRTDLVGFGYFSLFIVISVALFMLLLWLANNIFYKSLLSGQEVQRKKRILSSQEISQHTATTSSPIIALFKREWKMFLRTPIYAMNGLAGIIMMPFILLMSLFTQEGALTQIVSVVQTPEALLPTTLILLGITTLTSNMGIVSCTSVSREGSTFWMSKMLPVAPREQIVAKLLHGMSIALIGIVVISAIATIFLSLPVTTTVVIVLLAILSSLLLNILNLLIDVLRPKLEWTNPQEAVKQNLNGFFGILLNMLFVALLGGLSLLLYFLHLPQWAIYFILAVALVILIAPSYFGLMKVADWKYRELDV